MASLSTDFTRLAGIDLPIVQAPIGSATTPELAAAVSNAGGLGTLSLTWRSPSEARELIQHTKTLTDKPFGVNLVLAWDPSERLAIALDEGVSVISLSWGDPTPWVEQIHASGALLAHMVGSTAAAIAAKNAGADVIVAQGFEASGHVEGQTSLLALIPEMVDAVAPTPVLAAGGIGDGRGLAAACCLGASGVWLGTRFVLSQEADAHEAYQQRLIEAGAGDTIHTALFRGGWPANTPLRTLPNKSLQLWEDAGRPEPGRGPGEGDVIGHTSRGVPIMRYHDDFPGARTTGDLESMVLYAGQSVGVMHDVLPAAEIVRSIADQANAVLSRLGGNQ
ncbi:MAG: nitronate monooxygenase [Thermomicrobiales bacterium]|nr:MAG: nitronate monooxygenase [Thermomicrobiales bacterium]